ncbi:hypothetical protein VTN77DRAFT_6469 [Rasamsonia byssochlamydoides]|uniref:uncharacterized protein n=1 Tax=Rasamsonia byssochlamydoides TaxID=89139 RepID=UPI0037441AD8
MADVRSLLRNELAARGAAAQTGSTGTRITKKRKIESSDDAVRKKSRAVGPIPGNVSAEAKPAQVPLSHLTEDEDRGREALDEEEAGPELPPEEDKAGDEAAGDVEVTAQVPPSSAPATNGPQTIDEDEWAAFEREVVAPTRVPQVPAAAMAPATISAAPVSAEELAAQQRKEKEELARAREADVEGEKEDAARLLEEEFDEMEQLEERVKRLKEKREEIRKRQQMEEDQHAAAPAEESEEAKQQTEAGNEESEEEEDDDEDWDDWRFR